MRLPTALCPLILILAASPVIAADTPLPYVTRPAFGSLIFDQPLAIVTPPGETNRIFIIEKPGRIIVINDKAEHSNEKQTKKKKKKKKKDIK